MQADLGIMIGISSLELLSQRWTRSASLTPTHSEVELADHCSNSGQRSRDRCSLIRLASWPRDMPRPISPGARKCRKGRWHSIYYSRSGRCRNEKRTRQSGVLSPCHADWVRCMASVPGTKNRESNLISDTSIGFRHANAPKTRMVSRTQPVPQDQLSTVTLGIKRQLD